ncbi:MAG: hypothetical protein R3E53_15365 [Myxococcota bacterium]
MIDFRLTETDRAQLERTRAEAMICRRYARELDENEEEMIPDTLPEADDFYAQAGPVPSTGPEDTQGPVMMLLQTMGHYWGDYSVRLKRPMRGGSGTRRSRRRGPRSRRGSGATCCSRWRSPSRAAAPIRRGSRRPPCSTKRRTSGS